ncbi:MAG: FABP family protein [Bowdeniella nasicola]|nr:FABP family protein [Bowdeniella nasicola]
MTCAPPIAHLAGLVGTWRGKGRGMYPTIESFTYRDELIFGNVGKPFFTFTQRTTMAGEPRHTETGFLRAPSPTTIEFVVAIPTGQVELGVGTCTVHTDGSIVLHTLAQDVQNSPTAKEVNVIEREFCLGEDVLTYRLWMAAVGQEKQLHLESALERVA